MRSRRGRGGSPRTLLGRLAASVTTVAVAGGLMAFAHYGGFAAAHDPFPSSVVARP